MLLELGGELIWSHSVLNLTTRSQNMPVLSLHTEPGKIKERLTTQKAKTPGLSEMLGLGWSVRNHLNVPLPLSILAVVLRGEITDGSIYQSHSRLKTAVEW